jgi:hypothetical protein
MKLLTTNWAQWSLVLTAVALLTALHRLDLLAIVAPLAVGVGYAITIAKRRANSSGFRI